MVIERLQRKRSVSSSDVLHPETSKSSSAADRIPCLSRSIIQDAIHGGMKLRWFMAGEDAAGQRAINVRFGLMLREKLMNRWCECGCPTDHLKENTSGGVDNECTCPGQDVPRGNRARYVLKTTCRLSTYNDNVTITGNMWKE